MSQAPNLRPALRVAPGRRARPRERRPGRRHTASTRRAAKPMVDGLLDRLTELQERLWAERAAVGAHRPAGHRRGRQGRHDPQGDDRVQPAGLPGRQLQGADRPRSSPTTSCGGSTARVPGRGEVGIFNRSHYEDVLVVRVHELVPKDVWQRSLRPDQRLRGPPHRERHDRREVLPAHRQGRAASSASGRARTTRRSAGSSRSATSRSASTGTTTSPPTRTRCRSTSTDVRRGTSSRRTASGSATSRSRRSSPTRSRSSIRSTRNPRTCRRGWSSSSAQATQAAGEFDEPPATPSPKPSISSSSTPVSGALPASARPIQPRHTGDAAARWRSARGATPSHAAR